MLNEPRDAENHVGCVAALLDMSVDLFRLVHETFPSNIGNYVTHLEP